MRGLPSRRLSIYSLMLAAASAGAACSSEDTPPTGEGTGGTGGAAGTSTASAGTSTGGSTPSTGGSGSPTAGTTAGGAGSGAAATGGSSSAAGTGGSPGGGSGGSGGSGAIGGGGGSAGSGGPSASSQEDTGLDCKVAAASGPNGASATTLPDPFTKWDGAQVKNMADWRCRRRELVEEVEKRILGPKAPPPSTMGGTVSGSVTNTTYSVQVDNPGGKTSFSGTIKLPGTGTAPYPAVVVIGGLNSLNTDVLSSEGVATLSYDNNAIAAETSGNYSSGKYFDANPDFKGKTGALVAWAWGVSRILDMLEKNPTVIDPKKIAVHGCSRLGKAAFVIGAFDQRIALGLPLEPGTGGPAPLRALPSLGGQTVSSANSEASWFGPPSKTYSATMAAADMSDVAVMYAPRGLLMMDNPHIDHLSYKANYLGSAAAKKVYDAMGSEGLWYLGNSGNGNHCAVRAEYGAPLRAMIKKFLKADASAKTGGLDTHANHGNVDVAGWTKNFKPGTIAP
ncbi:MAG: cellulose-binding protein [Myxococcales bacterium]|nr:MAG: cellulose-binding protein [Myxococcales bacterium]